MEIAVTSFVPAAWVVTGGATLLAGGVGAVLALHPDEVRLFSGALGARVEDPDGARRDPAPLRVQDVEARAVGVDNDVVGRPRRVEGELREHRAGRRIEGSAHIKTIIHIQFVSIETSVIGVEQNG